MEALDQLPEEIGKKPLKGYRGNPFVFPFEFDGDAPETPVVKLYQIDSATLLPAAFQPAMSQVDGLYVAALTGAQTRTCPPCRLCVIWNNTVQAQQKLSFTLESDSAAPAVTTFTVDNSGIARVSVTVTGLNVLAAVAAIQADVTQKRDEAAAARDQAVEAADSIEDRYTNQEVDQKTIINALIFG